MPGFLTTPDGPENADAQALPNYPTYPSISGYPDYPGYPTYPVYPTYPGYPTFPIASSSSVQESPDGSFAITTTHHVSPVGSAGPPSPATSPEFQAALSHPLVLGVDSLVPSDAALLANSQSSAYLGRAPQFWGRYFYAPGQINTAGHRDSHYSAAENALLRARGIRVLPIARQTSHVNQPNRAQQDASRNAQAIFEAFSAQYLSGADPNVLVFLDVEQGNPMVAEYYAIWSEALIAQATGLSQGRVKFHPAVYGSRGDEQTWSELKQAMNDGAVCDGVWIARYFKSQTPRPWNDSLVNPTIPLDCPILAWQYWASADGAPKILNFDANLASPAHFDILIDRLIMPPAA
jgi:hypothetical protein